VVKVWLRDLSTEPAGADVAHLDDVGYLRAGCTARVGHLLVVLVNEGDAARLGC
jgi:hypothetical protein